MAVRQDPALESIEEALDVGEQRGGFERRLGTDAGQKFGKRARAGTAAGQRMTQSEESQEVALDLLHRDADRGRAAATAARNHHRRAPQSAPALTQGNRAPFRFAGGFDHALSAAPR